MPPALQTTLITASFAVLGIVITQLYNRNIALRAELKGKKQKIYAKYINFLVKAVRGEYEGKDDVILEELKSYFPELLTYASNDVIKNTADFMQHFYNPNEDETKQSVIGLELFGDLIIAIRNDLGHKKFRDFLKWHDIPRIWITDIDKYLPTDQHTPRGNHTKPKPIFDGSRKEV